MDIKFIASGAKTVESLLEYDFYKDRPPLPTEDNGPDGAQYQKATDSTWVPGRRYYPGFVDPADSIWNRERCFGDVDEMCVMTVSASGPNKVAEIEKRLLEPTVMELVKKADRVATIWSFSDKTSETHLDEKILPSYIANDNLDLPVLFLDPVDENKDNIRYKDPNDANTERVLYRNADNDQIGRAHV